MTIEVSTTTQIIAGTLCGGLPWIFYGWGYYRGAKMALKIGKKHLNDYHDSVIKTFDNLESYGRKQ